MVWTPCLVVAVCLCLGRLYGRAHVWSSGLHSATKEQRGNIAFRHLGDCVAPCSIICFRTEVSVFVQQLNTVRKYSFVLFLSWLKTWERGYSLPFLTLPEISIVEICMTFMLPLRAIRVVPRCKPNWIWITVLSKCGFTPLLSKEMRSCYTM